MLETLLLRDLRLKGGDLFYIPSSSGGSFNINTIKQIMKLRSQFHSRDDPVAIKRAGNCVRWRKSPRSSKVLQSVGLFGRFLQLNYERRLMETLHPKIDLCFVSAKDIFISRRLGQFTVKQLHLYLLWHHVDERVFITCRLPGLSLFYCMRLWDWHYK